MTSSQRSLAEGAGPPDGVRDCGSDDELMVGRRRPGLWGE
jgi:hypothetical protein